MPTANTYKAMIATTLISSVVVFLGFTLHLKKQSKLASETFYELEPEPLTEENKEALEDILKSLDNLLNTTSTNQAYNETNTDAEDEAFEQQMEEIRNRNNPENSEDASETTNESSSSKSTSNENEANAFDDINDIIAKTSEKKRGPTSSGANKNSSISYSLINRTKIDIPPPIYLCEMGGKVVINIKVDSEGTVADASYNNAASTTDNGCLVDTALEYAKASLFNADSSKPSQIGTITFIFTRKH
jgi:outer membrane biosynthesis protein TonB